MTKLVIEIKDNRCFCTCFRPPRSKKGHEKESSSSSSMENHDVDRRADVVVRESLREFCSVLAEAPAATTISARPSSFATDSERETPRTEDAGTASQPVNSSPGARVRNAARQLLARLPASRSKVNVPK